MARPPSKSATAGSIHVVQYLTSSCKNSSAVYVFVCAGYDISRVGNEIFETSISVTFGNVVFLLATPVDRPGVIFAYRTHIANADAMLVLQLWRPASASSSGSDGRHFQLVDVVNFSPNSSGTQDVRHPLLLV